jgi:hypothetical protein
MTEPQRNPRFSNDRRQLLLVVYEKIVVGVAVAAVSASLLYVYNVYSKAFEAAQVHSSGYSAIGAKLKQLTIDNSFSASQEFKTAFERGDPALSKDKTDLVFSLATNVESIAFSLETHANKTANAAERIAKQMKSAALELSVQLDQARIQAFNKAIANLDDEFLASYKTEIGEISVTEFRGFFAIYEDAIPWYFRSQYVILGCAIFVAITSLALWGVLK